MNTPCTPRTRKPPPPGRKSSPDVRNRLTHTLPDGLSKTPDAFNPNSEVEPRISRMTRIRNKLREAKRVRFFRAPRSNR